MKKVTAIIIVLLFMSCNNNNNNTKDHNYNLEGNWSVITLDSTYYEINTDSIHMLFYNYDTGFWPIRPYYIKNDSIFINRSKNDNRSIAYEINNLEEGKITLESKDISEKMKLFKIDSTEFTFDKMKNFEKDELKYEISYLNRKNKLFGNDYRYDLDSVVKAFNKLKEQEDTDN